MNRTKGLTTIWLVQCDDGSFLEYVYATKKEATDEWNLKKMGARAVHFMLVPVKKNH